MVPVASSPSIMTRPAVGSCSPATMLKIVLLPQPDGPIRLTNRPDGTVSETCASASNAPAGVANAMLTSSSRTFVGEAKAHLHPRQPGHETQRLRKYCAMAKIRAISPGARFRCHELV